MKRILSIVLFIALLALFALPAAAANVSVTYDGRALNVNTLLKNGTTYVPLRAFCDSLGDCNISWNASARRAAVSGACSMTVTADYRSATCGGANVKLTGPCYISGGVLWVPVRAFAASLGCEIGWNQRIQGVTLTPGGLYWLSRIIHAEAGAEPYSGKIAVGNVVLNRVASDQFPNTIHDVIFDSSYGGQFTPVSNGTINCTPSAESIAAARACLAGENTAGNSLYFFNPQTSTRAAWIEDNCDVYASIGNHAFYA